MKFSKIVDGVGQAVSIRYNNMVYDLQRAGTKVIVMSLGEAFFDMPLYSMDELPVPAVFHYSHSRGLWELRRVLADHLAARFDVPVDPETELLVTAGSKAAIYFAFMSILDPGDEVLLPEPAWVSYREQIKLCHGVPVGVPMDRTTAQLADFITPRTRAIVVTNPHNPRGYVYPRAELEYLLELAEKHDLWLLSDEAYSDFVDDDSFVSLGAIDRHKQRTIVFNSISKNCGISGWRIGYVIANAQATSQMLKVNQHLITCPPTILCHYVARYFDRILAVTAPQIVEVLQTRRALQHYMDELGLSYMPGTATFYFFVRIAPSTLSSEEFATRLLLEGHVATVPGSGYGASCDQYLRVSFGTVTMEDSRQGLRAIKALIEQTSAR